MLNIKFEDGRKDGEYFVELTKNRGLDIVNCDRLGYWCDKPHLVHMGLEILAMFNHYELFAKLLKDPRQQNKEKPENNAQHTKSNQQLKSAIALLDRWLFSITSGMDLEKGIVDETGRFIEKNSAKADV